MSNWYKSEQDKVTVLPGQMIFVITREDVLMPPNLCGSVYSRNKLALDGILALNAGHVDPGYEGPIVIRLINLSIIPWTLTLGDAIFTLVFQTLDVGPCDKLIGHRIISTDEMLSRVRRTADAALSNALYDLYASENREQLRVHFNSVEQGLQTRLDEVTKDLLRRDEILRAFFNSLWKSLSARIVAAIVILAAAGTLIYRLVQFLSALNGDGGGG